MILRENPSILWHSEIKSQKFTCFKQHTWKTTGWCKGIRIYDLTLTSNLLLDQKKILATPLQAEKKKLRQKKHKNGTSCHFLPWLMTKFCFTFAFWHSFWLTCGSQKRPMLRPQFSLEKNIPLKPMCWTWIPSIILDFRDP